MQRGWFTEQGSASSPRAELMLENLQGLPAVWPMIPGSTACLRYGWAMQVQIGHLFHISTAVRNVWRCTGLLETRKQQNVPQAWSFLNICIFLYLFFFYYSLTSFLEARNRVVFVHCILFVSQEKHTDLFFSNRLQKLPSFLLSFYKCPQTLPWWALEKKEEDLCVVPQPSSIASTAPEEKQATNCQQWGWTTRILSRASSSSAALGAQNCCSSAFRSLYQVSQQHSEDHKKPS